jgi:hypothetical protein
MPSDEQGVDDEIGSDDAPAMPYSWQGAPCAEDDCLEFIACLHARLSDAELAEQLGRTNNALRSCAIDVAFRIRSRDRSEGTAHKSGQLPSTPTGCLGA